MLQQSKECYFCGTEQALHLHHIFGGTSNRKNSTKYGMTCWLCYTHHNGAEGVHTDRKKDLVLKCMAQDYFEENIGTREDFRRIFGKSYK